MSTETHVGFRDRETVDLSSLSDAGYEDYDPTANTGVADPHTVDVVGQTDPSYRVTWNPDQSRLDVRAVSDGSEPAEGTDCGSVDVVVEGRR
jgi:hypothetical protein